MTTHLYTAPAGHGKTDHVLHIVRDAAHQLACIARVVVSTRLQARSWRRRLAEAGGALGVRVLTFDMLYSECLDAADEVNTRLSEPVQHRLIRSVVRGLDLEYYASLVDRPGFVPVLQRLMAELKAARAWPDEFAQAVTGLGSEPRLAEMARIYAAYQEQLQAHGWADRPGLGWLAVEALEERSPQVARDWPLLVVDGFDSFTPVQLALLKVLAGRVGELLVTLTGGSAPEERPFVHRRFDRTRVLLQQACAPVASSLPETVSPLHPVLAHLERSLFKPGARQIDGSGVVEMTEAPDRATESRSGLRWLKARIVEDGMRCDQLALLTRSIPPYRSHILETAAEFGLPVRMVDGLPLLSNPAVAALLNLLRLMLPRSDNDPQPALPRRSVVDTWRSPYFDWAALPAEGVSEPIGIEPGDADRLDIVARWGRVIGGLRQWDDAFDALAARTAGASPGDDEERGMPAGVPDRETVTDLRAKLERFIERLTPPQGFHSARTFVGWLESIIGPDPSLGSHRFPSPEEPTALSIVVRARKAVDHVAERDVAALQALKDILRGLVWAEESLTLPPVDFSQFLADLEGASEAAIYHLPPLPGREEILVADVVQARGVPFRAVAVLGLAEGEFPVTVVEDAFLRDDDRQRMGSPYGLELESSTESAEAEFFYEAVTRPRERLLLTRPRLADNGAPWQPSPYWEEIRRLLRIEPSRLSSESRPAPDQVASWPELMESLAASGRYHRVRQWVAQEDPVRQAALDRAALLLSARRSTEEPTPFDGDLTEASVSFDSRFGPQHVWSGTSLESYRACPFWFFVGHVLQLEPRREPQEGLDARQLGSIYHRILEKLYAAVDHAGDLVQLMSALPEVARGLLDEAPAREGFRVTAWWQHTRAEIVENMRRSLEALDEMGGSYVPYRFEAEFGLRGQPALEVQAGEDTLRLRGVIDRIDRSPDGRLRIIDYKTSAPGAFGPQSVADGKKLQLPLYALAAREALRLGEPCEGFYFHVRHAEASRFHLSTFGGGPEASMELAVEKGWEAVHGVRKGHFAPHPPDDGCPSYCPAVTFCWHYTPGYGG